MQLRDAAGKRLRLLSRDVKAQRSSLAIEEHRPWEVPSRPWVMGQTWLNLLFAHWPVEVSALERLIPPGLTLDTFNDSGWIGITPFFVRSLRARNLPPFPLVSHFPEVNVRTYVTVDGRPGIYFFSLDTSSRPAVRAARWGYRLPYAHASIAGGSGKDGITFINRRGSRDAPLAALALDYRPTSGPRLAPPESLDYWLTERYCLYTLDSERQVLRGDIHHRPWLICRANAEIRENTMTQGLGIDLEGEPIFHFAPRQNVVFWTLHPVRRN